MALGLEWVERFSGSFSKPGASSRQAPAALLLRAVVPDLARVLRGRAEIVGTVRAPGLATLGSVVGVVTRGPGFVARYALDLVADDGTPLSLVLEKRGFGRDLYAAATTVVGEARDPAGGVIATLALRVDVRGGKLVSDVRFRG
jgi:hypothetical protein